MLFNVTNRKVEQICKRMRHQSYSWSSLHKHNFLHIFKNTSTSWSPCNAEACTIWQNHRERWAVFTSSFTFLSYRMFFPSCLTNKGPPDSPLLLRCAPTLGRFKSVTVLRKRFGVIITYRISNKNSPVLQQMLKMLPSCMNALSTTCRSRLLTGVLLRK